MFKHYTCANQVLVLKLYSLYNIIGKKDNKILMHRNVTSPQCKVGKEILRNDDARRQREKKKKSAKFRLLVGEAARAHEARLRLGRLRSRALLVRQLGDRLGELEEDLAVHLALPRAFAARHRARTPITDDETATRVWLLFRVGATWRHWITQCNEGVRV